MPLFSLSSCSFSVLWTFSSFVWLGAIVRQTDPSAYTYISLHTRFVGVLWFVDDGPPTAFYRSPMLLSSPVSSPGTSAGKPFKQMARVVIFIYATCSNPSSSSSCHRRLRLFSISKYSVVSSSSGRRDQTYSWGQHKLSKGASVRIRSGKQPQNPLTDYDA